jgi:hypothetical protein
MATIKPLRQYNESDVINMFSYDGATAEKGIVVKISAGWKNTDEPLEMSALGGASYDNVVSQRYGNVAKVTAAGTADKPIGMLLMDVKETDENGERLLFNPRKAAEMGVVISGQAVPVLTRGIVLYSGAQLAAQSVTAGATLYVSGSVGELSTYGTNAIGKALGGKDDNNFVLIKLEL